MVAAGAFREDLYYRLNVVSIEMPPLRERKDDILPLALFFTERFCGELKKKIDGIAPDAQKLLMRYNWPGNIRELENAIERAMLLTESPRSSPDDLRLGEIPDGRRPLAHRRAGGARFRPRGSRSRRSSARRSSRRSRCRTGCRRTPPSCSASARG